MIIVKLCGGLGNQLFQYAAGRSLAQARGVDLLLDLTWYDYKSLGNTKRTYELGNFNISACHSQQHKSLLFHLYQSRVIKCLPDSYLPWFYYRENGFSYDQEFLNCSDNTYLDGYWQSYRYLITIEQQLREELKLQLDMSVQDEIVAEKIFSSGWCSVSLHVRRGDYVNNPVAAKTHGVSLDRYYERAIEIIFESLINPHFFIFSDDIPWVIKNLPINGRVTYVNHNTVKSACQDLRLMSFCSHHIIANSSFSWWGAWLNKKNNNFVIAPAKWFNDTRNTNDLTPENWLRL